MRALLLAIVAFPSTIIEVFLDWFNYLYAGFQGRDTAPPPNPSHIPNIPPRGEIFTSRGPYFSRESENVHPPASPLLPNPLRRAIPTPSRQRKTLVLDLDETLVHSTFHPVSDCDIKVHVVLEGVPCVFYVFKRPFVDRFLGVVCAWFEVVVFTASLRKYADPVIDRLDPYNNHNHSHNHNHNNPNPNPNPNPYNNNNNNHNPSHYISPSYHNHNDNCPGFHSGMGNSLGYERGNGVLRRRYFRDSCVVRGGSFVKDLARIGQQPEHTIIIDNSPAAYSADRDNAIPIQGWFDDPDDTELLSLIPLLDALRFVHDVRSVLSRKDLVRSRKQRSNRSGNGSIHHKHQQHATTSNNTPLPSWPGEEKINELRKRL